MRYLIFILLVSSALAYTEDSGTKTLTTDGSSSDVQAAVDRVNTLNEDGWKITLPSGGTDNYSTTVDVDCGQSVTIMGLGTIDNAVGAGSTAPTINSTSSGVKLHLVPVDGKIIWIKNIIFAGDASDSGFMFVEGYGTNVIRVSNTTWDNITGRGIVQVGPDQPGDGVGPWWLFDHNWVELGNGVSADRFAYVFHGENTDQWDTEMTFGTVQTLCFEDNVFTNAASATAEGLPLIDSAYYGPRLLIRHNDFTRCDIVAHGAGSVSGTLQLEILHNTFRFTDTIDNVIYFRGGTGYIWDNSIILTGGSAWINSIVDFAVEAVIQRPGRGAVGGVEADVPVYEYQNTVTLQSGADWSEDEVVADSPLNNGDEFFVETAKPGYTELEYPHPLVALTEGEDEPPPEPPTNLRLRNVVIGGGAVLR